MGGGGGRYANGAQTGQCARLQDGLAHTYEHFLRAFSLDFVFFDPNENESLARLALGTKTAIENL